MWKLLFSVGLVSVLAPPAAAQSLDEAIADALARAPQIAQAEAEADAATARVQQAVAAKAITATAQGTMGVGYIDMNGFFSMGASSVVPRAAQVTVEKPLFTGGRIDQAVAQAQAGAEASAAAKSASTAQLIMDVTQAYTGVQLADKQVALLDQSVAQMRAMERDARLMFQAGAAPKTDLSQAQARRAEAEAGLAQAEGNRLTARTGYRLLTGKEPGQLSAASSLRALPASLAEAVERATSNNPMIRQARAGVKASEAGTRASKAETRPTVGAFAEGAMVRDQFFPDYRADSATVGVRARWRFYDGGTAKAKIAEASAKERAATAQLRGAELMVEQQVTAAWHAVKTAEAVKGATMAQKVAANDALKNARLEFQIGAKPQLAVLDAQREATAAGLAEAQADAQLLLARTRLRALMGDY